MITFLWPRGWWWCFGWKISRRINHCFWATSCTIRSLFYKMLSEKKKLFEMFWRFKLHGKVIIHYYQKRLSLWILNIKNFGSKNFFPPFLPQQRTRKFNPQILNPENAAKLEINLWKLELCKYQLIEDWNHRMFCGYENLCDAFAVSGFPVDLM